MKKVSRINIGKITKPRTVLTAVTEKDAKQLNENKSDRLSEMSKSLDKSSQPMDMLDRPGFKGSKTGTGATVFMPVPQGKSVDVIRDRVIQYSGLSRSKPTSSEGGKTRCG